MKCTRPSHRLAPTGTPRQNASMRIDLRDKDRHRLFRLTVDTANPPQAAQPDNHIPTTQPVTLDWENAFNDQRQLIRCPACNCRELFVRRDFPQKLGLTLVIITAAAALTLFATRQALLAFAVLFSMALIDAIISIATPRCLVCYRCRTEFRNTPIAPQHKPHDLATAEKYKQP